jgi:hypothetical protein
MFVIQYEAIDGTHKMQDFDSNSRPMLLRHLARFDRPIMAVYEQSTPITAWARIALRTTHGLSRPAREFASSQVSSTQTFHQS